MPLLIAILLIEILAGAEVDLFIPSFPELQKLFNLTPFMVQLTLSANFVAYCVCSLFAGAFGDRFNRRTVMLVSLAIFVLGSLFCCFANHYLMLIFGRFMQGLGMAGPAVLSFVIIADEYPLEKQPTLLGILNGIVTLAMAAAPVLGSYINLYFNWRGNFVVLLLLGIIALIAGYFVIPNKKGNPSVSLSPAAYLPLLKSKKMMIFILGICFFCVPYWTFIGMAPILYMEDLGVPLKHFGYYQGMIALAFSMMSIFSSKIMNKLGFKESLLYSLILFFIATLIMFLISILEIQHPMIITSVMVVFAISIVIPVNILYPISLEIIEGAKSRIAALINSLRLLLTAFMLEAVSYIYVGKFLPLGLVISGFSLLSVLIMFYIFKQKWAEFSHKSENPSETTLEVPG